MIHFIDTLNRHKLIHIDFFKKYIFPVIIDKACFSYKFMLTGQLIFTDF